MSSMEYLHNGPFTSLLVSLISFGDAKTSRLLTTEESPLYSIPWDKIHEGKSIVTPIQTLRQTLKTSPTERRVRLPGLGLSNTGEEDAKVREIRIPFLLDRPAIMGPMHLTHFGTPLTSSKIDGVESKFVLNKKEVRSSDLHCLTLILPKTEWTDDVGTKHSIPVPPVFPITYHFESDVKVSRLVSPNFMVSLPFNGEVVALRVKGLNPCNQVVSVDFWGEPIRMRLDFSGQTNPIWVLRLIDLEAKTCGGSTILGEGINLARLECPPRIIFDHTAGDCNLEIEALTLNRYAEVDSFDFHTNYMFTL